MVLPQVCLSQERFMSDTLLDLAYQLAQAGEPFVVATVVWCDRPTSAKPGARAVIQANGQLTGWIGGSCAKPLVLREAARVLREGGDPYLLRLGAPDTGIVRSDVRTFPMTCTSGGILDIYMEPHFPQPQLLLIGDSTLQLRTSSSQTSLKSVSMSERMCLSLPMDSMTRTYWNKSYAALRAILAWWAAANAPLPVVPTFARPVWRMSRSLASRPLRVLTWEQSLQKK